MLCSDTIVVLDYQPSSSEFMARVKIGKPVIIRSPMKTKSAVREHWTLSDFISLLEKQKIQRTLQVYSAPENGSVWGLDKDGTVLVRASPMMIRTEFYFNYMNSLVSKNSNKQFHQDSIYLYSSGTDLSDFFDINDLETDMTASNYLILAMITSIPSVEYADF